MDDEDVIRSKMEDTRTSLTEKLETLEQQVVDTAAGVKESVQETVTSVTDSVTETVTAVKDTVTAVTDTVKEGVRSVKSLFDLAAHVEHHPWLMTGGAVALGFLLEKLIPKGTAIARSLAHAGRGAAHRNGAVKKTGDVAEVLGSLTPALVKLRGLAVGALMTTLREPLAGAFPEQWSDQVKEIIDSLTEVLGGRLTNGQGHHQSAPARNGKATTKRHRTVAGRLARR